MTEGASFAQIPVIKLDDGFRALSSAVRLAGHPLLSFVACDWAPESRI